MVDKCIYIIDRDVDIWVELVGERLELLVSKY